MRRVSPRPQYFAIRDSCSGLRRRKIFSTSAAMTQCKFIAQAHANLQLMSRDNFHLNDLGYQCMAEHVAHAVIVSLFVKGAWPAGN